MTNTDRKLYLDGLRGVAAVVVFIGHLLLALFDAFWIFNGRAAVCVFFVLSGFVLADLVERSTMSLLAQVLRRYLRLVGPMLLSSALAWALLEVGAYRNVEAAAVTESRWLALWYQFEPSFMTMIWETVYGVFVTGASAYNSNLWTMRPELIGSVFVFVIGSVARTRAWRGTCYVTLAVWFWSDYLLLFSVGALFYDFQNELKRLMHSNIIRISAFVAGLFFFIATEKLLKHMYFPPVDMMRWQMLSATLIVAAVLTWPLLQHSFGGVIGRALGRISFTLYLIHLPIICSLTSWLVITLPKSISVATSIAVTTPVVFIASFLLCPLIDQWPTMLSRSAGTSTDNAISSAWDNLKRRYAAITE
ncbi:acyltransferase family protein [Bradyrhizobium aeschynomenes]|uniref:acyltransferase family protein n=1 Tax=Bradyrhizobium aeschynomenes TaxID=2734909 RepID=UPI00155448E4|nr:acyltransferase [Bradyrhizobium aeschynomenes]NPV22865.1 acyltransferase [Bradyrhizobium aeschynomenes]